MMEPVHAGLGQQSGAFLVHLLSCCHRSCHAQREPAFTRMCCFVLAL